jgi:hypothetical protein
MAGDLSKPLTSEAYATQLASTRENLSDLAKGLDGTGTLNPPTGAIRWNSTSRYWEKNTGTPASPAWSKLVNEASAAYMIRVNTADTLTTGRTIAISGDASATGVSFNGSADISLSLTISSLAATKGGTGQTTWTTGNLMYASGTNTLAKLAVGTTGQVLRSTGTLPAWSTLANSDLPATLSSKTLDATNTVTLNDNQFTLQDQTDTSKKAQFDAAGLTTATTRTYTLPNANGTLMLTDMGQTVTNKTFSGGNTWNGGTIAVQYGGTGAATFSVGGFLTGNGTSAINSTALTGLIYGNGASVPSAASAAQIVTAIGATAVQNATNATNLTGTSTSNIPTSALGSGTANNTTFLRGDRAWASATPTVASIAEAQEGTDNTKMMTPLRVRDAFNAGGSAPVYACRAWVNFNGTGTPAIRASGNVSSITDKGVGSYGINFVTPMPDVNYAVFGMGMLNRRVQYPSATFGTGIQRLDGVDVWNTDSGTSPQDDQCINVCVFR